MPANILRIADSHSHIYAEEFDEDRDDVIKRARESGVVCVVMPATDPESIKRVIGVSECYPGITRMAFGLHPESVGIDFQEQLGSVRLALLSKLDDPSLVAIGEIGLDYYWDETYKREQREALRSQFEWALEMDLPVILHTRQAHKDMVEVVADYVPKGLRGVFHSFAGSEEELRELLAFESFFVGINGIVTFKKSDALRHSVLKVPRDRLLLETDAPYLAPVPHRGKRNEPSFLRYTLDTLAQLFGTTSEELASITCANALRLFRREL